MNEFIAAAIGALLGSYLSYFLQSKKDKADTIKKDTISSIIIYKDIIKTIQTISRNTQHLVYSYTDLLKLNNQEIPEDIKYIFNVKYIYHNPEYPNLSKAFQEVIAFNPDYHLVVAPGLINSTCDQSFYSDHIHNIYKFLTNEEIDTSIEFFNYLNKYNELIQKATDNAYRLNKSRHKENVRNLNNGILSFARFLCFNKDILKGILNKLSTVGYKSYLEETNLTIVEIDMLLNII